MQSPWKNISVIQRVGFFFFNRSKRMSLMIPQGRDLSFLCSRWLWTWPESVIRPDKRWGRGRYKKRERGSQQRDIVRISAEKGTWQKLLTVFQETVGQKRGRNRQGKVNDKPILFLLHPSCSSGGSKTFDPLYRQANTATANDIRPTRKVTISTCRVLQSNIGPDHPKTAVCSLKL